MTDFVPDFTEEQLNSMSLQDEIQNMLVDEVRRACTRIKFLEEENRIIKVFANIVFNKSKRDGERLVELEALKQKADEMAHSIDKCGECFECGCKARDYIREAAKELDV